MTDQKDPPLIFPCDFPVKVFGIASDQFTPHILEIIQKHIPDLHPSAIRDRPSKDGKYLALTINIHVESKAQLDAIYSDLTASPYVLMAL